MAAIVQQMKRLCLSRQRQEHAEKDNGQPPREPAIDPLIAAQVYNRTHSRLLRLPQEVLLHILHYLGNDVVDLYCLRRTSKQFRRLIYEPEILRYLPDHPMLKYLMHPPIMDFIHDLEVYYPLQRGLRKRLLERLRRDDMCKKCKLWFDIPMEGQHSQYLQNMQLQKTQRLDLIGSCRFKMLPLDIYICSCKNRYHPKEFVPHRHRHTVFRKCIGHRGSVKLCAHVHISWRTIETHVYKWQKRRPKDYWQACLDDFCIECHHASHDTRCTPEEAPTWPRARLQTAEYNQNLVVLKLEFAPHSGLDVCTPTPEQQIRASDLRALFRKHRQGPADLFFPPYPLQSFPEMVCFDPSTCSCVYYEGDCVKKPLSADLPLLPHDSIFSADQSRHHHSWNRRYGHGKNGNRVSIASHWPRGRDKPACLVTTYQRDILVSHIQQEGTIRPTHDWLHAMDPESYKSPVSNRMCKDRNCINYCRKQFRNSCLR